MPLSTPSVVTIGTLPITEGDVTNLTADLAAKTAKATLTTKGDVYAASAASTPARVGVGADGTVLTADAASAAGVKWAPGGGSQPITRAIYNLARSAVPANTGRKLDWAYSAGDALLDLTDPQNPVPVVSGVYAVSVYVAPSAVVGVAAVLEATIEIDGNNLDPLMTNDAPMNAGGFTAVVGVSLTYYCPNDSNLSAQIRHSDTGQSPDMSGQAFVQRLS